MIGSPSKKHTLYFIKSVKTRDFSPRNQPLKYHPSKYAQEGGSDEEKWWLCIDNT